VGGVWCVRWNHDGGHGGGASNHRVTQNRLVQKLGGGYPQKKGGNRNFEVHGVL